MNGRKKLTYWGTIKDLFQKKQFITAAVLVSKNIAKYGLPSTPEHLYISARVYREVGEYDSALQCWEQFFSANAENYSKLDALNEMALCFSKSHQYEAALGIYDQLLSASPRDKLALFGKSLTLLTQGDIDEAKQVLTEAFQYYPDDTRVINQYAKVLQYSEDYSRALDLYKQTLELEPNNFFAWSGLYFIYDRLKQEEEAQKALKKLYSLAGYDIKALDRFIRELYINGDIKLAADFLDALYRIDIEDTGFLRLSVDIYMAQGEQTNEGEYFQKALDILLRLQNIYKTPNITILMLIGICLIYLNKLQDAEEKFRNILEIVKPPVENQYLRKLLHKTGDQLLHVGKVELAIDYYRLLLIENTNDPYSLDGLAKAYRELGDYKQSIEIYKKKLKLYPNDIYALDGLALAYRDKGDLQNSVATFNKLSVAREEEKNKLQNRIALIRSERIRAEIDQFNQRKLSALSTMTSGISHELSQPLGIIRWNISALERDIEKNRLKEEELSETLEKIAYQTERINSILQTFKELSREHPVILKEVNLQQTIHKTFHMFSSQLKIRNIEVDLSGMQRLVPSVLADSIRVEQVLMNLILNSRDALQGRDDGLIVGKTYSVGSGRNKRILFTFADNGPGIPPEIRARIYDPFFSTKPVGRGTGLGLSIIFQNMQDMQGTIELDENYRDGARFKLWFRPFIRRE